MNRSDVPFRTLTNSQSINAWDNMGLQNFGKGTKGIFGIKTEKAGIYGNFKKKIVFPISYIGTSDCIISKSGAKINF